MSSQIPSKNSWSPVNSDPAGTSTTEFPTSSFEHASMLTRRRKGPLFAAFFGASLIGGIFYFVLSARSDLPTPVVVQPKPVAAAVQSAPAPAPAPKVVAVNTDPTVYFPYKKATLNGETRSALDLWVSRMSKDPRLTVNLGGFCDERGSKRYNDRLGERRAKTAKAYLVSKGVDPNRIVAVSYGKGSPAVKGHNENAWSQNRRVELRLVNAVSQR